METTSDLAPKTPAAIPITPVRALHVMIFITLALIAASAAGTLVKFFTGHDHLLGLIPLFNLDTEQNLPTLFSSTLLMISAALLVLIAYIERVERSQCARWFGLSGVFLFLSVDEFSCLHERLTAPVREVLQTQGAFYYAWTIPYLGAVCLLAIVYAPWFFRLERRVMGPFALAAILFLVGSLGFESLGSWYYGGVLSRKNFFYELFSTFEESLELFGVVVFVYALMLYIKIKHSGALVHFGKP